MAVYNLPPDNRYSGFGAAVGQGLTQGMMMKYQQQLQQQNMDKRQENLNDLKTSEEERKQKRIQDYYGGITDSAMANALKSKAMFGVSELDYMPKAQQPKGWGSVDGGLYNKDTGTYKKLPAGGQKPMSPTGKLLYDLDLYKDSPKAMKYITSALAAKIGEAATTTLFKAIDEQKKIQPNTKEYAQYDNYIKMLIEGRMGEAEKLAIMLGLADPTKTTTPKAGLPTVDDMF